MWLTHFWHSWSQVFIFAWDVTAGGILRTGVLICLVLIYINDLCSVCKHTFPILFADDTNLFSSGKEIKTLETNINNELSHISIWLKVNKLSLNIKKTHYMIFRKRKKDSLNVKLSIDGELINEVDKTKFLGVLIDNKLRGNNILLMYLAKSPVELVWL